MKRHNVILESSIEPEDKNVLWLHGKKLKKFGKAGWEDIIEGSVITTDRIENGAVTTHKIATNAFDSTLSKSEKIAPADVVGNKITTLDEKVDALALGKFYGYFPDSTSFPSDVSIPGYAYVRLDNSYKIWNFNGESWSDSGVSIDENDVIITTDRIEDGAVTIGKLEPSIQSLITNISKNASFAGIATPTTNPGTPDGPVFYIASTAGNYSNFGGIEISQNELAILYKLSNSWSSHIIQLGAEVIFDVSARFPTGGTDGTDNYTIETAIAAVPSNLRKIVRYLTFKISDTDRELWQFSTNYTAAKFENAQSWCKMRPSMYHEVEYKDNINSIRNSVPVGERISGLIIHYTTPESKDKYEMYVGENNAINADFWENFVPIYVASQIDDKIYYNTTPMFVKGDFANAIKELYIDKYEEGAIYQIKRLVISDSRPNGLIWINKQGDSTDYSVVNNNNLGGVDGGIVEVKSKDGLFHAYLIIDWSKITYG